MFSQDVFAKRRDALLAWMGEDSVAVVFAAQTRLRNNDTDYLYRQNSHFYYLTGFEEPEAVAVFIPGRADGEYVLFNRVRDKDKEIWDGLRAGQEGAKATFGADEAYPYPELAEKLPCLFEGKRKIFALLGQCEDDDKVVLDAMAAVQQKVRRGVQAPTTVSLLQDKLGEMRLIKDAQELDVMRQVSEISAHAHKQAMIACEPNMTETQLEAEFWYTFQKNNCRFPAYPMIIGGGANACILHYVENNQPLKDGDLVLIDAGAELHNYAADITRTFPVNGRFSDEQKAIYNLVLAAQEAGLKEIAPGKPWNGVQDAIVHVITAGLVELGILKGNIDTLISHKTYKQFYMHNSGHWIGLDVHDAGAYKVDGEWRNFEVGMALTVEPGIYIAAGSDGVDPKWWNIGVRIEDDVVVTNSGYENLTAAVPKTVEEIEQLMQSA